MPIVDRHYDEWAVVAKKLFLVYCTEWAERSREVTVQQKDHLALAYLTYVKEYSIAELAPATLLARGYRISPNEAAEFLRQINVDECVQRGILSREKPFHFSNDRAFWIAAGNILQGTYELGEYNPSDDITSKLEEFLRGGNPTVHDFLHTLNMGEPKSKKLEIVCRMM